MRYALICVILIQCSAASAVAAGKPFDPEARAKVIAPFIKLDTALVIHVDLSRLDLKSTFALLEHILPIREEQLKSIEEQLTVSLAAVVKTGVDEQYFVSSLSGILPPQRLLMVTPISGESQEKAFRQAFRLKENEAWTINGAVVTQFPKQAPENIRHSSEFTPDQRQELAAAFRAAGDSAVQILFLPPRATRRVIDELYPELPEQLGGGPSSILTRGVRWAAVGIDLAPNPSLRLVIQSDDAEAAEKLLAELPKMIRAIGKHGRTPDLLPGFKEICSRLKPKRENDRLVLSIDKTSGLDDLLTLSDLHRIPACRKMSIQNLQRITVAIHGYNSAKQHFPLPSQNSPEGKPLLSWRVMILPYLGEKELFEQFHLDEPWNSPHNLTLVERMPAVYRLPLAKHKEPGITNYLLPVGNGAMFDVDKPTKFEDIKDGTHQTIMVLEVDNEHAVVWTKPDDWRFLPDKPAEGLGRFFEGGFNAACCDGSVRSFSQSQIPKNAMLRAMFTRAGND